MHFNPSYRCYSRLMGHSRGSVIPVDDVEKVYSEASIELRRQVSSLLLWEDQFVSVCGISPEDSSESESGMVSMSVTLDGYKIFLDMALKSAMKAWGSRKAKAAIYSVVLEATDGKTSED